MILFVMTGADHWTLADGSEYPTGYWAPDFAAAHETFGSAGHRIAVATPGGVLPAIDRLSLTPGPMAGPGGPAHVSAAIEAAVELWEPVSLDEVRVDDFDAIYIPGGHGCMEDLATDPISAEILTATLSAGKPLGMSCHAPAALLATAHADGVSPFAGYRVTAFTNAEERQAGRAEMAKWLLADRLADLGIDFRSEPPWTEHVEVDRNVFTAQNPVSVASLATELVKVLA